MDAFLVVTSGLLYAHWYTPHPALWVAQQLVSLALVVMGWAIRHRLTTNFWPQRPWTTLGMGLCYAVSIGLPMRLVEWGWLDYAEVTFVRIAGVLFPLVLQWRQVDRRAIAASVLMAVAQILAWEATDGARWPAKTPGLALALLAAAFGAGTGWLQSRYAAYDPYGADVVAMHAVGLGLAWWWSDLSVWRIQYAKHAFPWALMGVYGVQTLAINRLLAGHARERTRNIVLGLLLALRKIASVALAAHWTQLGNPALYAGALALASGALVIK